MTNATEFKKKKKNKRAEGNRRGRDNNSMLTSLAERSK